MATLLYKSLLKATPFITLTNDLLHPAALQMIALSLCCHRRGPITIINTWTFIPLVCLIESLFGQRIDCPNFGPRKSSCIKLINSSRENNFVFFRRYRFNQRFLEVFEGYRISSGNLYCWMERKFLLCDSGQKIVQEQLEVFQAFVRG